MSAGRDELHHLVDELPDDAVPDALADVRRRLTPARLGAWPPAFFGSIEKPRSGAVAVSERVDEILAEGFGRD